MAHLKASAVRFKREPTKLKSEGWESGIAVIVEDITMSIIDMKGKPVDSPYTYHFTPDDGCFWLTTSEPRS